MTSSAERIAGKLISWGVGEAKPVASAHENP